MPLWQNFMPALFFIKLTIICLDSAFKKGNLISESLDANFVNILRHWTMDWDVISETCDKNPRGATIVSSVLDSFQRRQELSFIFDRFRLVGRVFYFFIFLFFFFFMFYFLALDLFLLFGFLFGFIFIFFSYIFSDCCSSVKIWTRAYIVFIVYTECVDNYDGGWEPGYLWCRLDAWIFMMSAACLCIYCLYWMCE